jgi:hypothetical protein
MIPSFALPFSFSPKRLKADLERIGPDEWQPHFNKRDYEGEWSGVALRSLAGAQRLFPTALNPADYADTEVLERCPYFRAVLATFRCPISSVRLLKLKAGSSILEHTDAQLGYEDGEARLHVPIVTDPNVEFFVDGRRLPMEVGQCWYVNVSLPHRVDNHGDTERVHLVIDCVVDDWLGAIFRAAAR